jgi:hypothetical protein
MTKYWTILLNRVFKASLSYISPSLSFIASSSVTAAAPIAAPTATPAAAFPPSCLSVFYLFFTHLLFFYISFCFNLCF